MMIKMNMKNKMNCLHLSFMILSHPLQFISSFQHIYHFHSQFQFHYYFHTHYNIYCIVMMKLMRMLKKSQNKTHFNLNANMIDSQHH